MVVHVAIYFRKSMQKTCNYGWALSLNFMPLTIVATVKFTKSKIKADEDDGPVQPVLVLSNPSSTDITVSVFSTDRSATGKDILLP